MTIFVVPLRPRPSAVALAQLEHNLKSLDVALTVDELRRLDELPGALDIDWVGAGTDEGLGCALSTSFGPRLRPSGAPDRGH